MAATWTGRATTIATAVAVAGLTGCGGDQGGADAPVVRPVVIRASAGGPFDGMTATALRDRVRRAMTSLTSVTTSGGSAEDGATVQEKVLFSADGSCAIAYEMSGLRTQIIIKDGMLYLKSDKAFWAGQHVRAPGEVAKKWVEMPAVDNPISAVCARMPFSSSDPTTAGGTWALGRRTTFDGTPVTTLVQRTGPKTVVYLVSEQGEPYILRAMITGKLSGVSTFSGFDAPPHIAAPPRSDTIGRQDLHVPHGSGVYSV